MCLNRYLDDCKKADIRMLTESGRLPLGNEMNFLCYMHFEGVVHMSIDDRPLEIERRCLYLASKKYNLSELKINRLNWKKVLEDALIQENKEIFLNRKNTVENYKDKNV